MFSVSKYVFERSKRRNLQGKWILKKALNKEVDDLGRQTLKADIINKMTLSLKVIANLMLLHLVKI
jgi:hypothetical protein